MDFYIVLLLVTSVLIPEASSQYDYESPQELDEPRLPQEDDQPYPYDGWDTSRPGCQTHFTKSRCVYEVFCLDHYESNVNQINPFSHDEYGNYVPIICPHFSEYNGYYGEVRVKLKRPWRLYDFVNNDFLRIVTTELDISDNEYTSFELPRMPVLKTLQLSKNSFIEAPFHNSYELQSLRNINFTHNTISRLNVEGGFIFKELRTIDLSHNYLVSIEDGIFGNFPELEYLDLSHNFIDALNMLTFEGVKRLLSLKLGHNRISQLDSSLFRFNRLEKLVLNENRLQTLKFTDFEKLGSLQYLDISSNKITVIEENTFSTLTSLKTLNLRDNDLNNINQDIFDGLSYIKNIDLSNNKLRILPKDTFKDKHISEFCIRQNILEGALVQGTFEGMGLVTELDLSFQFITSVEDYAFYNLFSLRTLLLNYNNIETLSNLSFKNVSNLRTLDLTSNKLTYIDFAKEDLVMLESLLLKNNLLLQVQTGLFDGLSALQFLDLSQNNITHLETNSFRSLRALLNLQIADNPISGVLEEHTFSGLTSLPNIDISGTLLTVLKNGSFYGMTQLKDINLSHSEIVELQFNAFINTGAIEVLDLSFNKLTHFNINATDLITLISLNLKNNTLTIISPETLNGLPRLSKIIISFNNIESVEDSAFANQIDLRYLDLSYNKNLKINVTQLEKFRNLDEINLSGIQSNISFEIVSEIALPYLTMCSSGISNITTLGLKHLKTLGELILCKNNIAKVEANNFKGLKTLIKLDLSCNQISYIQSGTFKENTLLTFLNISHNFLKFVNYGIFRGLSYLETVDMSYNEIKDLQSERFYEVRSLKTLIADSNKISMVSVDNFFGTSLETLSIGANPIPCDVLVNFKKNSVPFQVTAIKLEENSDFENVDGVTCNVDGIVLKTKHESDISSPNEKILLDIKNILHNISIQRMHDKSVDYLDNNKTDHFVDLGNTIKESNIEIANKIEEANVNTRVILQKNTNTIKESNIKIANKIEESNLNTSLLLQKNTEEIKNTNFLLDKFLKVLSAGNEAVNTGPAPVSKYNNITTENLSYINSVKKQLEDTIAAEKRNIWIRIEAKINEAMEKTINKLNFKVNASTDNSVRATATHEAYTAKDGSDTKSFLFIEICVGLILVMMILFILYKFYNSGIFIPSGHSNSTRHLSDPIDNSVL